MIDLEDHNSIHGFDGQDLETSDPDLSDDEDNDDQGGLFSTREFGIDPSGMWKPHFFLYLENFMSSWIYNMWQFSIYLCLSFGFPNSYLIVPTLALISKSLSIMVVPFLIRFMEDLHRLKLIISVIIAQAVSMAISLALAIFFCTYSDQPEGLPPWNQPSFVALCILIFIFGGISETLATISYFIIQKDWTFVIANSKQYSSTPPIRDLLLSQKRVSLISKAVGPILFGLLSFMGMTAAVIITIVILLILTGLDVFAIMTVMGKFPDLNLGKFSAGPSTGERISSCFSVEPFRRYFSQKISLASISYAFLYFSALAPGPLLINYLAYLRNIPIIGISVFQALATTIGMLATLIVSRAISRFGLAKTGLFNIWLYFFILSSTLIQLLIIPQNPTSWIMLIPIVLSRIPLWSLDAVQNQLIQETITESERVIFATFELNLANVWVLVSYVLAITLGSPAYYPYIALVSLIFSLLGCGLYTIYFEKESKREPSYLSDVID